MHYLKSGLLLMAISLYGCKPKDTIPASNLAGKVAGTYSLNTILGGNNDVKGTGSVTITALNDTTVSVQEQTSFTTISSGAITPFNRTIDKGYVNKGNSDDSYSISYPQPGSLRNQLMYGNILLGNRLNLDRTVGKYSLTVEYIRK